MKLKTLLKQFKTNIPLVHIESDNSINFRPSGYRGIGGVVVIKRLCIHAEDFLNTEVVDCYIDRNTSCFIIKVHYKEGK